MEFSEIARRAGKFAADNSPAILTGMAVLGVASTAILTGRASFRAAQILGEESSHLTPKEVVERTWKLYIPAAGTGLLTVACIIGANRISDRRAAALAGAFSLSQKAFEEYRSKVIEKIGETKEEQVRTEIAQERINSNPPTNSQLLMLGPGKVLCLDLWSGRYFDSSMEELNSAVNKLNHQINNNWYASLNDFYSSVNLENIEGGEDIGWNSTKLVELFFSHALAPGGVPCLTFSFNTKPVRDYYRGH